MTELLERALRQIEKLPASEQDAAAGALFDYLAHHRNYRLSDDQLAEARRRRADPARELISRDEVRAKVQQFGQ
jgi:hypothetical protein